jgi:hypothetical protein
MSLLRVMMMRGDDGCMSVRSARCGTTGEEATAAAGDGSGYRGGATTAGGEERHCVWSVLRLVVCLGSCRVAV